MKRFVCFVLTMIMLGPVFAWAEWGGETTSVARWSLFETGVGIMTGIGLGFSLHEGAHRLQAEIEGVDTFNESLTSIEFNGNNREARNIALAGFIPGIIGSEIVLGVDAIPKDNSIVIGYMLWNILHPLSYIVRHELIYEDGYGDLKTIDNSGLDSRYVEAGLLAHSLLSAFRLYSKKEVPIFVKATHNEIMVGLGVIF